jgi:hypothetical protein
MDVRNVLGSGQSREGFPNSSVGDVRSRNTDDSRINVAVRCVGEVENRPSADAFYRNDWTGR